MTKYHQFAIQYIPGRMNVSDTVLATTGISPGIHGRVLYRPMSKRATVPWCISSASTGIFTPGEATVAQYRIIRREQQWHLVIEGQECGLLQCDDRNFLVQVACSVAAERGSAVQVFDARDELEARLYFRDGTLTVDGSYMGEVGAAQPER